MSTYNEPRKTADEWAETMQSLMDGLDNREPFSYDPESDLLYRQYREQYQKLGRQAMEDTVGQAAALTGGYGSTYGEIAGAEAYDSYLGKLNDVLPELYDRKRSEYDRQTDAIYDRLSFAANERQAALDEADAAFDRCMKLLENGVRPADAQLEAAGISAEMASTALAIFQQKNSSSGRSSGSGSSGRGSSGSGSPTAAQIKELQAWLGVEPDGIFGAQTQAAAKAMFGASEVTAAKAWQAYLKMLDALEHVPDPGRSEAPPPRIPPNTEVPY